MKIRLTRRRLASKWTSRGWIGRKA